MEKRLIISALVTFPIILLANHYWFDRSWASSLFGAVGYELTTVPALYFFLRWWRKKAAEQNKA
ncbi:MAG TPA: hypothetical protein PKL56_01830 [Cyclobacteriaceae bacterium]|nr:hypothetical protein [Cyclobacteriaceae bacterium]HMV10962.1 hypothetical protein [Cyclobacteriaceae bacterium]HMV89146.1 hypothetical protein [Cyclobacteriaceae bacterium]HMX00019.1 hypothetical protein [Cyclobacteriaceae bacterium]HMX49119.1 hypothetical protein [Cyclobacteriaceae bacterium]